MDRDVYLILIGAGISLASSIVMLFLHAFLDLIMEKIRSKERQREELRRILLDDTPPKYTKLFERLVLEAGESGLDHLIRDINWFVYSTSRLGTSLFISFLVVFGTVFLTWVFIVIPKIH